MARFDAALRAYERALALAPANASLLVRLGASLVQRGELERAAAALERARREDPNSAVACLELGRLEMHKAEYGAARRSLECAVRLDPSSVEGHYRLWRVYRELGERQLAERIFRRWQDLKRQYDEAYGLVPAPSTPKPD
jgi:Tfp pilus assembly protein PilF